MTDIQLKKALFRLPNGTYITPYTDNRGAFEIGDIGQAIHVDESLGLRRILNGQTVAINSNTQAFLNKLNTIRNSYPNLFVTNAEWEEIFNASKKGQCGKFVITETEIRLPAIVNLQGLMELEYLGDIKHAGYPKLELLMRQDSSTSTDADLDPIYGSNGYTATKPANTDGTDEFMTRIYTEGQNSLRYMSLYDQTGEMGASDTVQEEAVQYPYFIQIAQGQHTMRTIRNDWEINNPYTIFDAKQSQYPLNNTSWLKSLGQWNEKAIYTYAYEALLVELNNSIETNTTVDLPSGGKYTKHLQTVNFDVNKVDKVGEPVIENGILYSDTENYVRLKVGNNVLATAKSWSIDLKFQKQANSKVIFTTYDTDSTSDPFFKCGVLSNGYINILTQTIRDGLMPYSNTEVNIGDWCYIHIAYDDAKGYDYWYSLDGITYRKYNASDVTKVLTDSEYIYFRNAQPIDLRTVQFKYSLDGIHEYLVTTGVEYKSAVWNKAEHTTSETEYAYNFIVDTVNESFRLPLYDRVFNNPYAELYYYIGDTLQNTSLIDIGRLSESITVNKSEIEQLRILISQIAGDIPTIEPSTYGVRNVTLYNGIDLGDHIIDLSSYIPLDGHQYDVHLFHYMNVGDTSASNHNINIYNADRSQLLHKFGIDGIAVQGSSTANNGNFSYSCCIPLPANSRIIILNLNASGDKQFSQYYVQLVWFRKY